MSTEQDKDAFSLKRNRGGEGGLDVLGGPGLLLGIPDKKRRKSSTQVPSFSPLSEYAPPPNTSSDHLIAANPFDDNYNSPSLKPLPPANPYFGRLHYPGFSGYGPPRMAPQMPQRMPSPYGPPYQMRNQPVVFNRAPGFNYGHAENPHYGQPFSGGNNNRIHFRSEHVNQIPLQNLNQSRSPDVALGFGPARDMSPNLSQQLNNFTKSRTPTPKQDPSEAVSKNATQNPSPRKQSQNCEENNPQDNTPELKTKSRPSAQDGGAGKLNGVIHSTKSADQARRTGALTNNKVLNRRRTSSSSEPVFPCGMCLSEVNDDQEAILCEASCQKWFHRVCTGMTETAYNLLTAEVCAVWGCDACMEDNAAQLRKTRAVSGTPSVTGEGQA